jgi:hypothetical protein
LKKELEARTRELREAREEQAATAEVLQVISSSPGKLEPVFETMLGASVRFRAVTDHPSRQLPRLGCAMCGRLRVGKAFLHVCRLVGAAMCSACLCGHMTAGHNAFRGSGPGQKPAFEMHWHKWVVLIAGSTGSALRAVGPPNFLLTPDVGAIGHAASATGCL